MSEKFRVVTNGLRAGHHFEKGDIVAIRTRNYPVAGLNTYEREDGLLQALDTRDVEPIDE